MIVTNDKLTALQVELLKSFRHITSEKELDEVKSLLNLYFRKRLDIAIDKEEEARNLTAEVYSEWLNSPASI
jgi:hypothetical protein